MDDQDKRLMRAVYDRLGAMLEQQEDAASSLRFFKGIIVFAVLLAALQFAIELLVSLGILSLGRIGS